MWASYTSFCKGYKQMYSVYGIIGGKQKSDGESDSILKKESRFRSVEIGESEIVYMNLYQNRQDLVNQNEI
jgi:hypothetical protein